MKTINGDIHIRPNEEVIIPIDDDGEFIWILITIGN